MTMDKEYPTCERCKQQIDCYVMGTKEGRRRAICFKCFQIIAAERERKL